MIAVYAFGVLGFIWFLQPPPPIRSSRAHPTEPRLELAKEGLASVHTLDHFAGFSPVFLGGQ